MPNSNKNSRANPKILMINSLDSTYGSTHRIREMCCGLRSIGWDIDYIESNYQGDIEGTISINQQDNAIGFLRATLIRFYCALTKKYDIFFTQTLTPLTVPSIIAAKIRGKKVFVDWDDLSWTLQKNIFRAVLVKFCEHQFIKIPDAVSVHNTYLLKYGKEHGARNIFLAHQGVDFKLFDPANCNADEVRHKIGLKEDRITLGFLVAFTTGGVVDLDFIYKAVKSVIEQRPNVQFIIIGGGALLEKYLKIAEEINLVNTYFIGFVNQKEVPSYLGAIDIALIYMRDNIKNRHRASLKVREYLAMNKVVVGHIVGQTKDDFASFCKTCDASMDSFVNAIVEAVDSYDKKKNINTRDELIKEYSWDNTCKVVDNALKEYLL